MIAKAGIGAKPEESECDLNLRSNQTMMGIDPVKPPSYRDGNLIQRFVNHWRISRPNQAGNFLAVLQKDQSWPELHFKRPAKRMALAILDFNMAYFRMSGKGGCDQWLSNAAMTAPRRAELDDTGTFEEINFNARRLSGCVTCVHAYFAAQSGYPPRWTKRCVD